MRLKDNTIRILGIRPELLFAIMVADEVYKTNGYEAVITCLTEGKHSETSLHYSGCAVDLRTNNMKINPAQVVADIKAKLNIDFDVIYEVDHIHIEYQPRFHQP